jgi:molecular chaperone DnaK
VITRKEFEDNCRTLIDKAIAITRSAVKKSKLGDDQINEVLLVGGSSRIPMVKDLLHRMFGKRLNVSLNPEEIVCYGATLRAAQLAGDEEVCLFILFNKKKLKTNYFRPHKWN